MRGNSMQDHTFTVKQITQQVLQEKKIFLAFVDLEKAFNKVGY